jgi:antitoxin ParD1/3/4
MTPRFELAIFANNAIMCRMPTRNVNLSPQQARFISRSVNRGRYRNASEVVRDGLRLLEQQQREDELKLKALRRIADQAFAQIDRGDYEEVDVEEIDAFIEKVDARARASVKK